MTPAKNLVFLAFFILYEKSGPKNSVYEIAFRPRLPSKNDETAPAKNSGTRENVVLQKVKSLKKDLGLVNPKP